MRTFAILCGVLAIGGGCSKADTASPVAASKTEPAAAGSADTVQTVFPDAPVRTKLACDKLVPKLDEQLVRAHEAQPKIPLMKIRMGWGDLPTELRELPPGASFCGSIEASMGAQIASSLYGKDLESFYAPLMAKLGCQPLRCGQWAADRLQCRCSTSKGVGNVTTDPTYEAYSITYIKMK